MAVHEDVVGIEASICIDGQPVQEYHTETDEANHNNHAVKLHQSLRTITKYIESQTDKEFAIKAEVKKPYNMDCARLQVEFYVDGKQVHSALWMNDRFAQFGSLQTMFRGPETAIARNAVFQPMKFSKIETSELIN
jgi:hypothetical protein